MFEDLQIQFNMIKRGKHYNKEQCESAIKQLANDLRRFADSIEDKSAFDW